MYILCACTIMANMFFFCNFALIYNIFDELFTFFKIFYLCVASSEGIR